MRRLGASRRWAKAGEQGLSSSASCLDFFFDLGDDPGGLAFTVAMDDPKYSSPISASTSSTTPAGST